MGPGATDEAGGLLLRVAQGDGTALRTLFFSEGGRLVAIARRIVRSPELAEDVVQDCFAKVWKRAGQFEPERGSGRAWLTVMVRNSAINLVRDRSKLQHEDPDTVSALGDRQQEAQKAYGDLADTLALKACLGRLEEPRRMAILLCYVSGLSHGEVAASLDTPLGTVKAWIRRGMISLQECLS